MQVIQYSPENSLNQEYLASSTGLSASRFRHFFQQQPGIPYRRYRIWRRKPNLRVQHILTAAFVIPLASIPRWFLTILIDLRFSVEKIAPSTKNNISNLPLLNKNMFYTDTTQLNYSELQLSWKKIKIFTN